MRAAPVLALLLLAPCAFAGEGSTSPITAPDRKGGVYMLDGDSRGLWIWHLRGDGVPATGFATAQPVDTTHGAGWSSMVADGFGGTLISYRASRDTTIEVRVMRVQPGSAPASGWSMQGDLAATTPVGGGFHGVAPDFVGGMYTAWQDFRSGYADQDIVMQHLGASATPALGWPGNGLFICDAPGDQYDPTLTPDPAGGVFAAWWDARAIGTGNDTGTDIWAQSVSADGTLRWAADGVPITLRAGHQINPAITYDGQGGVLAAWTEALPAYVAAGYGRVGMLRVSSSGNPALGWPANGRLLGDGSLTVLSTRQPPLVPDGLGGAYTMWAEAPVGAVDSGPWTVRLQHIAPTGAVASGWPALGMALSRPSFQPDPTGLVSDGAGGVIASWAELTDPNTGTRRVWVQRVRQGGSIAPGWPSAGVLVVEQPLYDPAMVSDFSGGSTLLWRPLASIFNPLSMPIVRRITHEGVLDPYWGGYPFADGQPVVSPTPSSGAVNITYALPTLSSVEARVFDLLGRQVRQLALIAEVPAGRQSMAWDGRDDAGDAVPAGLYFVRLRWAERDHTARVVIAR